MHVNRFAQGEVGHVLWHDDAVVPVTNTTNASRTRDSRRQPLDQTVVVAHHDVEDPLSAFERSQAEIDGTYIYPDIPLPDGSDPDRNARMEAEAMGWYFAWQERGQQITSWNRYDGYYTQTITVYDHNPTIFQLVIEDELGKS